MSRILIAWELGSGLGHIGPLWVVGTELLRRGHTLAVAAPNTELCRQAFAGLPVETIPAPALPISPKRLKYPCTYSDILHDCGYSSAEHLTVATGAWLRLFDDFRPDLLLADHSPTALLASRATASRTNRFATAALGISFACPPDITPLPSLRSEIPEPHWAEEVERTVLVSMNTALAAHDGPALARVAEVFGTADEQYLLTLDELDQYRRWRSQDRHKTRYWRPVGSLPGTIRDWPTGPSIADGPRVFVYLRKQETLLPILKGLAYKQYPTLCYAPHLEERDLASFAGSSVSISTNPLDTTHVSSECDVAVLHGGNATVCEFLLAGVPMLVLPRMLEQQVTAERIAALHVGLHAPPTDLNAIGTQLEELLADPSYRDSARSIAQRYPAMDQATAVGELVDDMEHLAAACQTMRDKSLPSIEDRTTI